MLPALCNIVQMHNSRSGRVFHGILVIRQSGGDSVDYRGIPAPRAKRIQGRSSNQLMLITSRLDECVLGCGVGSSAKTLAAAARTGELSSFIMV